MFNGLKKVQKETNDAEAVKSELAAVGTLVYALGLDLFTRPGEETGAAEIPENIQLLADQRWQAKAERDFAQADDLRAKIAEEGWLVVDRPDGYELTPKS